MNIANFRVDRKHFLGQGAFGKVFVALDEHNIEVAAKQVLLENVEDVDIHAEVQTLKQIKPHKNILKYIATEISGDCLWIFTEYCEEGDLSSYWETHELELTQIIDIAYQCACALHHLHSLQPCVVHRDIKPQNILLSQRNLKLEVKLADFGIAKVSALIGETLVMRTICGTKLYLAPEFFLMEQKQKGKGAAAFSYGRSVDIYALGMVLAELVEAAPGQPLRPFHDHGKSLGELMFNWHEQNMRMWCPITLEIDDTPLVLRLKALISAMLSFNQLRRPKAETTMQKLKDILDDAPKLDTLPRSIEDEADDDEIPEDQDTDNAGTVHFLPVNPIPDSKTVCLKPGKKTVQPKPSKKTAVRPTSGMKKGQKKITRDHNIRGTVYTTRGRALGRQAHTGSEYGFILVGGSKGYNAVNACWELETPEDGFYWKSFATFPEAIRGHHGHSICIIDENSFAIAGGSHSAKCQPICYQYSVKLRWQKLPNAKIARCSAGLVCLQNVLYYLGGEGDNQTILRSCEKLDLNAKGKGKEKDRSFYWMAARDMLQEMVFPLVATAEDKIYVVSNTHEANQIKPGTALTLQCLDPKARRWRNRAALPSGIRDTSGASVVGDGGFLYLLAGWERLCVRYSVEADSWTILNPCRAVHSFAAACISDRKINVFGGRDERGPSTSVSEYDTEKDEWRERTLEMPEPIVGHYAFVLRMREAWTAIPEEDEMEKSNELD